MTQYLLSVHSTADDVMPPPDVITQMYADVAAFNEELRAGGAWVFAGGLQPVDTATVVKMRDGEVIITDGPFAEAKERLSGFWVIEAVNLDAAVALAAKGSAACRGPVEVRPFQDEPADS